MTELNLIIDDRLSENNASMVFLAIAHGLQEQLGCNDGEAEIVLNALTATIIEQTAPDTPNTKESRQRIIQKLSSKLNDLLNDPVKGLEELKANARGSSSGYAMHSAGYIEDMLRALS